MVQRMRIGNGKHWSSQADVFIAKLHRKRHLQVIGPINYPLRGPAVSRRGLFVKNMAREAVASVM